ncbi:hypothetical protein ACFYVL_20045 [Streptomyces sp. NPDC004111]|uniref:hypothetical protein n=1 Tax=Streptomyces sp. NPDC004111 TaxID=3364690 RepID=UPI003673868A
MRQRTAATAAAALLALALSALTGCGPPPVPPEATGTLEELAAQAGCVPDIGTEAAELRQASCRTSGGDYVLTTFATDRGRQEWFDAANDYGGSYLVGRGWIAAGDADVVTALRGQLGGTVETTAGHSGSGEGPTAGAGRPGHHAS